MEPKQYFTVAEFARKQKTTTQAIYRHIERGLLTEGEALRGARRIKVVLVDERMKEYLAKQVDPV